MVSHFYIFSYFYNALLLIGLPQLLTVRTHRKFLGSRIAPEMESKIGFLALKVKFGQQKRYQEWFFRQVCVDLIYSLNEHVTIRKGDYIKT